MGETQGLNRKFSINPGGDTAPWVQAKLFRGESMKVRAQLFCGLLIVFAFAGKILAQGAPAAGTIEVKVGQAIDSDRDASGKEYAAIVTQTVNAGGVTITQGSLAMVTLVKAAERHRERAIGKHKHAQPGPRTGQQFLGNGDGIPGAKSHEQAWVCLGRQAGRHRTGRGGAGRDSDSIGRESLPHAGEHIAVCIQHWKRDGQRGSGGCGSARCSRSRASSGARGNTGRATTDSFRGPCAHSRSAVRQRRPLDRHVRLFLANTSARSHTVFDRRLRGPC